MILSSTAVKNISSREETKGIVFSFFIASTIFVYNMAIFVVDKSELEKHPHFEEELALMCETVTGNEQYLYFTPKVGFLAPFGVLLMNKHISYQLEFKPPDSPLF